MNILHTFTSEFKMMVAGITGLATIVADMSSEAKGWEDLSLKAILITAIIFIGRLYLKQQEEHKAEMRERDDKLNDHLEANTTALREIKSATDEQTLYFKTVTRNIVDQHIKHDAPHLPP